MGVTLAIPTKYEITVYAHLKPSPGKARVHNNLGYAYLQAHQSDDARREFTAALQLDPNLFRAQYNLQRLEEEVKTSDDKSANSLTPP